MWCQRNVSLLYFCLGWPVRLLYQRTHTHTLRIAPTVLRRTKCCYCIQTNVDRLKGISVSTCFCQGFGSFVEKTVMPYISTTPAKLLNPCTGDQNCTSPFSYKNVLKLTSDGKKFNTLVGQQQISGNLDSPEGGFDAIMQVAVCEVSSTKSAANI